MEKVLIIEDNDGIRENTEELLQLANYQVFSAANGKIGVEIALRENPHLILCDIVMPVLDGFGVLNTLRNNPATQSTPFIFMTALAEKEDLRKGMQLGADDFIVKPFNDTDLLQSVERRLEKSKKLKEEFAQGLNGLNSLIEVQTGKELLQELVIDRKVNKYRKKQVVFSEGNRPAFLYFVQKGKVKTYKMNDNGKQLITSIYKENEFLGYLALLQNENYQQTAVAMEDTELVIVPRKEFEELIDSNHEVSRKFIEILARNISENETKLLSLAYNSLRKKVADALLTLYDKYEGKGENFEIRITRENLASIAGTALESLIRTLGDFKREKLIDIKDGTIIILDKNKLEHLLN
ncbi:MAG TPA: response regulator [Hanamia sp.]|nr:response regulator [Hanamia sp.]